MSLRGSGDGALANPGLMRLQAAAELRSAWTGKAPVPTRVFKFLSGHTQLDSRGLRAPVFFTCDALRKEGVQRFAQVRLAVRNSLHVPRIYFEVCADFRLTGAAERATLAALPLKLGEDYPARFLW